MLEVMTRRYYWIRPLRNVQVTERSGRPLLTAEYAHDGRDYLVIATVADAGESAAGTDLPQLIDALPSGRTVLVDLYVTSPSGPGQTSEDDPDARADRIRDKLGVIPPAVGAGRGRGAQAGRRGGRLAGLVHLLRRAGRGGGGGPDAARLAPAGGRTAGLVAALRVRADPAARGP